MRRSSSYGADPNEDEGVLARIKSTLGGLFSGDGRQQALPLERARGQTGSVVPYHERRLQLQRARRRQHSSYALIFIVVLLVLVVGIFYGLTWALSGAFSLGGGAARATPTAQSQQPTAQPAEPTSAPPSGVLPTPAPGGTTAGPSPAPGASPKPGATAGTTPTTAPGQPTPAPGTPAPGAARTYVVKAGDTPGGIARMFGITTDALMRANNIADPTKLAVGQTLIIPAPEPTAAPR